MSFAKVRNVVIAFAGCALLLASCGTDDGDDASPTTTSSTTSTTTSTTAPPSTTLAEGETEALAEISNDPPDGYSFVDAPSSVVQELSTSLTANPDAAEAVVGSSVHSIVNEADDESIGILMLVEIAPEYAALPNFAEELAAGFGEGGQSTEIADTQWTIYEDAEGGLTYLTFGRLDDGSGVMLIVLGDDTETIETFLAS